MGWLPVYEMKVRSAPHMKMHWEYQGVPLTRYFGGLTAEYQTDIKSLASGIANAGMKMEYILFDDCYMSSIEVAYELKDVTECLMPLLGNIYWGIPIINRDVKNFTIFIQPMK